MDHWAEAAKRIRIDLELTAANKKWQAEYADLIAPREENPLLESLIEPGEDYDGDY